MGEIKGQLLGIILTLVVFGGVSVAIARVYQKSSEKVTTYSTEAEVNAADQAGYEIPEAGSNGLLHY